jgi:hypothetical protein
MTCNTLKYDPHRREDFDCVRFFAAFVHARAGLRARCELYEQKLFPA